MYPNSNIAIFSQNSVADTHPIQHSPERHVYDVYRIISYLFDMYVYVYMCVRVFVCVCVTITLCVLLSYYSYIFLVEFFLESISLLKGSFLMYYISIF